MIVCGTRDNSICERFPGKCDLTLSKAISSAMVLRKQVGMTAKFSDLNLPSDSSHHWSKCPAMDRFVMFSIKQTTVCCQRVHKKVHEILRNESGEPSDQSHSEFFI